MRERPLSPHISVYRMTRYSLLSSITNRITGVGLSVGLVILAYWLHALSQGEEAYRRAVALLSHPLSKIVFTGLLIAFCYHLVAGIRHLVWDTGRGMERRQSMQSAALLVVATVVLAAILGWFAFRMGQS